MYLREGFEIVGEGWNEVLPRLWCHIYAHSAEVGSGVRGDQRVPDAPAQSGESHQGLSVLTVCQKAVAFKQGCLHIAKITKKSRIHSRVGIGDTISTRHAGCMHVQKGCKASFHCNHVGILCPHTGMLSRILSGQEFSD